MLKSSLLFACRIAVLPLYFAMIVNLSISTSAQQLTVSKPTLKSTPTVLTAQQIQIVNSMTSAQVQAYVSKIQPTLTKLKNDIATHQLSIAIPTWQSFIQGTASVSGQQVNIATVPSYAFKSASGGITTLTANALFGASPATPCPVYGCNGCQPPMCGIVPPMNADNDQDGLPDAFEGQVADAFTPYYGVSSSEQDQFATFGNYVPMTVTSLVGTVPPYSYYRVQPLGLATDPNGNQVFALRIDYLTLWNADNGLVGGGVTCYYSYVGLDGVVGQLTSHELDAERSGMLVAAPTVNGGYNPNPDAYSLYTVYTAAHEGTFFDQSMYASFSPAVAAGNHLELALSLSKHSTYTFNPDYYPMTPAWFIADYNDTIFELWQDGVLTDDEYYLSLLMGNDTFYGCIVERFGNQGGSYANQRVNVGEPTHPINGSTFIQDDSSRALHLTDKLTNPLF